VGYVLAHVRNCGHLSRKREAGRKLGVADGERWPRGDERVREDKERERERERFRVMERASRLAVAAERAMHHGIA